MPAIIQAIYTQNTDEHPDWNPQTMTVNLLFEVDTDKGPFGCGDSALMMDSLAGVAWIPGLDFLTFIAVPGFGVSAMCDSLDHVASSGGELR